MPRLFVVVCPIVYVTTVVRTLRPKSPYLLWDKERILVLDWVLWVPMMAERTTAVGDIPGAGPYHPCFIDGLTLRTVLTNVEVWT